MAFKGPENRKKLLLSMLTLAGLIGAAVLATSAVSAYLRSQDPINQCITDPSSQPYQISVPVTVLQDGTPDAIPEGIGITRDCIRPIHTLEENVIHVAYSRPHPFTLGHFLYYWLGDDLLAYNTDVYINGVQHSDGDFRDILLQEGDAIRIEFSTRGQ